MAIASIRPLDIVMLAPVALPGEHGIGGVQSIVSRQARWLAGRGHRVRLITCAHPSGIPALKLSGVEHVFLGLDKGLGPATGQVDFTVSRWRAATRAAWPALLADGIPDVVHGHAEAELGLVEAGLIGRGAQFPALSTLYGSTVSGILDHLRLGRNGRLPRPVRGLRGAMGVVPTLASARWLRRTRVVALSSRHARLVALSYGLRDVSVVPPGVDTLLYHPPAAAVRASLRARLGVPSATFTWAVVGRVAPGKGVELAVRALAHLTPNEGVGDHLLVAGSGPSEPAIDALVSSLGLAHCITCAGDVKPPAAAYMCADALLFPTGHEESFGMAALEAMSCGVPVLARDRGAVPEVLAGNGVLVPSGEPRDWAAAMAGLRSDGARRTSSSIAGRRRAVEEYSHVKTVAALERLYVAAKAGAR